MAAKEDNVETGAEDSEKPKSKKLLIIGLVAVMMVISGGGAWLFATKTMAKNTDDVQADGGEAEEEKLPLNYLPLSPAFIVNFSGTEEISFLQVDIQVGTRDADAINLIKEHRPAIRNSLVMLFSSQDPTTLSDRAGKNKLRSDALTEVQTVMKKETGSPVIENIYFTSFVMQ